jgi:hypothetical protein
MFDNMHLLWHPHTNRLFCALWSGRAEVVIDCVSEEIVHTVWAQGPRAMCWNRVNDYVYALGGDTVYAFTAAGDSIVAKIPLHVGYYGEAACFAPFPNKVYVTADRGRVYAIDCNTDSVLAALSNGAAHLLCDTFAGKVYASGDGLDVYDARADTGLVRFSFGGAMAWNGQQRRVYVATGWGGQGYVCTIRDTTTGLQESLKPQAPSPKLGASIVRGVLWLESTSGLKPQASSWLLDLAGRRVLELQPGANDVRRLNAGVYFLRRDGGRTAKIVISR